MMSARTPNPHNTTFDLTSCRDMLGKLGREILRASTAVRREDTGDHCTNAAWTAWHLAEWVWADIKHNYALKCQLANDADVSVGNFDRDAFIKYVQSEGQCPDLSYLGTITVASKHAGTTANDDPPIVVHASAAREYPNNVGLGWMGITEYGDKPLMVFKFVEGENRSNAIQWLKKVHSYWAQFIDNHNISAG